MPDSSNTLEGLLADLLRRESNSIEIIQKLQDIQLSTDDKIIIEYTNNNNEKSNYEVPSIGYLISEIKRIDNNLKSIIGLGSSSAIIKYNDGSFKTVFVSSASVEPPKITGLSKPLYFKKSFNKISEKFLNPSLYTNFDLTGLVEFGTKSILCKRLILNLDTNPKINFFNINLNAQSVDYNELLELLDRNDITFDDFEEKFQISPKLPKFRGYFSVSNIYKRTVTKISNSKTYDIKKLFYKLDKIIYSDISLGNSDVVLKVGDKLIVNNFNSRDTIYQVDSVDTTTNEISVTLIEGYDAIRTGVDTLMISPGSTEQVTVDIPLVANEYVIAFFKPVNPVGDIINLEWGSGIGYNSDEFLEENNPNNLQLKTYYNREVDSFGKNLQSMAKEKLKSFVDGLTPNKPVITATDLQVQIINDHKSQLESITDIRVKLSEADLTKSNIINIDKSITDLKTEISTISVNNVNKKQLLEKNLSILFGKKNALMKNYSSLVSDMNSRTKEISNFSPKYAIRGFFPIPEPRYENEKDKLGEQAIIQFIIRYRYLKKDGTSTQTSYFKITDTNTETKQNAVFSKWVETKSHVRKRSVDESGNIIWLNEDDKNPDINNINQIDIPITADEQVEIQIKSISEAGYPYTPLESEWSDSAIIDFPAEYQSDFDSTIEEIKNESIKNKLTEELVNAGVYTHVDNGFQVSDKFYFHDADYIAASEFRTPENKPLTVAQVLKDNDTNIKSILAYINQTKPEIGVQIVDENSNILQTVNSNDTVNIFAGYYDSLVSNLSNPKGAIISKIYYIEISNLSDADLELLSYVPGLSTDILPNPNSYVGYIANKDEYEKYRKYNSVPITLRGITDDILINQYQNQQNPWIEKPVFQSSQSKGQMVYSRYTDITLSNQLYHSDTIQSDNVFLPDNVGSNQPYVWDYSKSVSQVNGNGKLSDFCVHIDHPSVQVNSELMSEYNLYYDTNTNLPLSYTKNGLPYYPWFWHSKYFNLETIDVNGNLQMAYIPHDISDTPNLAGFAKKFGFSSGDQYLIGKNTCGSYLSLSPIDLTSINTGSVIYNEGMIIESNGINKIRIPFVYQFRMEDYFGVGTRGKIGGYDSTGLEKTNLSYAKKIGIDIIAKNLPLFSFDIQVSAKFKPSSIGDTSYK